MKRAERQEKIDYLSRAMDAHNERVSIDGYISILRDRMTGVKGISYEGADMPRSRNRETDLSDYAARIDRELRSYKKAAQQEQRARKDVKKCIQTLAGQVRKEPDERTHRKIRQSSALLRSAPRSGNLLNLSVSFFLKSRNALLSRLLPQRMRSALLSRQSITISTMSGVLIPRPGTLS